MTITMTTTTYPSSPRLNQLLSPIPPRTKTALITVVAGTLPLNAAVAIPTALRSEVGKVTEAGKANECGNDDEDENDDVYFNESIWYVNNR